MRISAFLFAILATFNLFGCLDAPENDDPFVLTVNEGDTFVDVTVINESPESPNGDDDDSAEAEVKEDSVLEIDYLGPNSGTSIDAGECGTLAEVSITATNDDFTFIGHRFVLFTDNMTNYPFSSVSFTLDGVMHEDILTSVPHINADSYIFYNSFTVTSGSTVVASYSGCVRTDVEVDTQVGSLQAMLEYYMFTVFNGAGEQVELDEDFQYAHEVSVAPMEKAPVEESFLTATLNVASPSGASIPGMREVFRFNLSASNLQDEPFNYAMFDVFTTDNEGTGWNTCGQLALDSNFVLYNTSDLTTPISIGHGFTSANSNVTCEFAPTEAVDTDSILLNEVVPAGTMESYALFVNTEGASSMLNDTFRVNLIYVNNYWYVSNDFPIVGGTLIFDD